MGQPANLQHKQNQLLPKVAETQKQYSHFCVMKLPYWIQAGSSVPRDSMSQTEFITLGSA